MWFSHLLHASDHRSLSRSHLDNLVLLGVVGVGRAAQVEVREALLDRGLHPRASAPLHHDQVLIDHSLSWKSCNLENRTCSTVDDITLRISCVIVQVTFCIENPYSFLVEIKPWSVLWNYQRWSCPAKSFCGAIYHLLDFHFMPRPSLRWAEFLWPF